MRGDYTSAVRAGVLRPEEALGKSSPPETNSEPAWRLDGNLVGRKLFIS